MKLGCAFGDSRSTCRVESLEPGEKYSLIPATHSLGIRVEDHIALNLLRLRVREQDIHKHACRDLSVQLVAHVSTNTRADIRIYTQKIHLHL